MPSHHALLKYKCPNPLCNNFTLITTEYRGGRWCPACKCTFKIIFYGVNQHKPKLKKVFQNE